MYLNADQQTTATDVLSSPEFLASQAGCVFSNENDQSDYRPQPSTSLSPHQHQSLLSRRSISPNAKLLATYQVEESTGQSAPFTSPMIDFPLKSSFRRQSYTPEELQGFSTQTPLASTTTPSTATQTRTALKYNTQLNSLSPSYTDRDEEHQRADRRRSLRSSISSRPSYPHATPSPPKKPTSTPQSESIELHDQRMSPQRLIRTPRSFLIKRGGSLTPLNAPVCGAPAKAPAAEPNPKDLEDQFVDSAKRKVRFDKEVFCLQFDQLPEEFPSVPRQKKVKVDPSLTVSCQDTNLRVRTFFTLPGLLPVLNLSDVRQFIS